MNEGDGVMGKKKRKHKYIGYKGRKGGRLPEYTGFILEAKKESKIGNSIADEGVKTDSGKIMTSRSETIKKYQGRYSDGMVRLKRHVTLQPRESEEILNYQIVTSKEVDIFQNKISEDSNLGRCLLGKKQGEMIRVPTPSGVAEYLIIRVE